MGGTSSKNKKMKENHGILASSYSKENSTQIFNDDEPLI